MLDKGHRIGGRYRLLRVLAQGGMGSVWVAEDAQLGREVAVKVMVPAAFALPDLVARFHREAKAAAHIRSAHVVQIFDHGIDGDQPFIVMELLEGEDLAARLRRVGRMSLDATVELAIDVCKALKPAHEQGVVHRDLKPANVFLARQDDGEVVKVLDIGVAKLTNADAEKTQSHALLGTPHYMAPEQTHDTGTPVDLRADLWSLAVIAFRALTGELPFSGDNPVSVMMAVASRTAPAPSSVAPDLGLGFEVDRFFATALARDRTARFQSAQAFREAIARLSSRSSIVDMRASRPSDPRFSTDTSETLQLSGPTPAASPLPFAIAGGGDRTARPAALGRSPDAARTSSPPEARQALSPSSTPPPAISSAAPPPAPTPLGSGMDASVPLSQLRTTIPLNSDASRKLASLRPTPGGQGPSGPNEPPGTTTPAPLPGAEPTPAVMSSTQATVPKAKSGTNWVILLAAIGAILATGIVILSVLSAHPDSGETGSTAAALAPSTSVGSSAPGETTGFTAAPSSVPTPSVVASAIPSSEASTASDSTEPSPATTSTTSSLTATIPSAKPTPSATTLATATPTAKPPATAAPTPTVHTPPGPSTTPTVKAPGTSPPPKPPGGSILKETPF